VSATFHLGGEECGFGVGGEDDVLPASVFDGGGVDG